MILPNGYATIDPRTQTVVLCGDCLAIKPYSDDLHAGTERCDCGGEMCGCPACNEAAREVAVLGVEQWLKTSVFSAQKESAA